MSLSNASQLYNSCTYCLCFIYVRLYISTTYVCIFLEALNLYGASLKLYNIANMFSCICCISVRIWCISLYFCTGFFFCQYMFAFSSLPALLYPLLFISWYTYLLFQVVLICFFLSHGTLEFDKKNNLSNPIYIPILLTFCCRVAWVLYAFKNMIQYILLWLTYCRLSKQVWHEIMLFKNNLLRFKKNCFCLIFPFLWELYSPQIFLWRSPDVEECQICSTHCLHGIDEIHFWRDSAILIWYSCASQTLQENIFFCCSVASFYYVALLSISILKLLRLNVSYFSSTALWTV